MYFHLKFRFSQTLILGGNSNGQVMYQSLYLDESRFEWNDFGHNLIYGRESFACSVVEVNQSNKKVIVVAGGIGEFGSALNSIETFNGDSWERSKIV